MPLFYTNALDEEPVYERCESFGGGMDSYQRSTLLPPDAFQYGENTVVPDNFEVRTRAGADVIGSARAAKIQGIQYFDTPSYEQLIVGTNATMQHWNGSAWTTMTGWTPTDADRRLAMAQGVGKVLITDGGVLGGTTGGFAMWDGASFTLFSNTNTDPPERATILLWHAGRMWAAGFDGSATGKEDDAIWASALLAFGGGDWNGVDRSFRVGGGEGDPITALASMQDFTMAVCKQNSIHLIRTDPTNVPVTYSDNVPNEVVSYGVGCVGKRALCNYGNDLLFVSPDKSIRSLQRMQAAATQYQLSAPISLPIQPYIDRINWDYAHLIAAVKYRELALFSVPLDASTVPNYVFAWNGRLQRWVGIWSGWTPNCWEVSRFAGVQRLNHGDNAGNVRRWKDTSDATDSATYLDDAVAIPTKLWTRAFLFGEPLNDKDAYHCEVRFSQSSAVVTITLIGDNSTLKTWTADIRPNLPTLPIQLPFNLVNPTNTAARKGTRGLAPFNECYLKIESTEGWFSLRNVSLSAFINTLASR